MKWKRMPKKKHLSMSEICITLFHSPLSNHDDRLKTVEKTFQTLYYGYKKPLARLVSLICRLTHYKKYFFIKTEYFELNKFLFEYARLPMPTLKFDGCQRNYSNLIASIN